jgi:hypothetical protein
MIKMPLKWHHIGTYNKNCRKCVDKDFGLFVLIRTPMYDAFMWNWSKFTLCDDALFIASCINHAFEDEIQWTTLEEKVTLGTHLQKLLGCIGFIDGTLIKMNTTSPSKMRHIAHGLMGVKRYMQCTTWSFWTIMSCSST